jgi:hypothetical protein
MKLRLISLFALVLFASASAFAWNCSDPLASRVACRNNVNPSGTAGDGDGQWFLGTGSVKAPRACTTSAKCRRSPSLAAALTVNIQYEHQHQQQFQHSKVSNSNSNNNSSSSNSSATGGNATSTATGGNSSSKSGVNNSGNSSNTNNNTANGGSANGNGSNNTTSATGGTVSGSGNSTQGQKQGQGQTQSSSSNNSGGNSSNSYSSNTQVDASKIPVNTAFAPTTIPTVSCFKGFGAGVQTMPVGASFGGGKIDENCRALQTALHAPNRLTYCKLFINLQDSKKAHITMEDCMGQDPKEEVVVAPPPVEPKPEIVVVPVVSSPAPVPAVVVPESYRLGICTFAGKTFCTPNGSDASIVDPARPTSVCKEMISAALAVLRQHPGYMIVLTGNRNKTEDAMLPAARANRVKQQFVAAGVKSGQIKTEVGSGDTRTVSIDIVPAVN